MLDLAIIGLSPQHPRSFSQLINEENPNGEGLNGVARISMLWDRDRAAAEEFAADHGLGDRARRSDCGDRQSRRRAGARRPRRYASGVGATILGGRCADVCG